MKNQINSKTIQDFNKKSYSYFQNNYGEDSEMLSDFDSKDETFVKTPKKPKKFDDGYSKDIAPKKKKSYNKQREHKRNYD